VFHLIRLPAAFSQRDEMDERLKWEICLSSNEVGKYNESRDETLRVLEQRVCSTCEVQTKVAESSRLPTTPGSTRATCVVTTSSTAGSTREYISRSPTTTSRDFRHGKSTSSPITLNELEEPSLEVASTTLTTCLLL